MRGMKDKPIPMATAIRIQRGKSRSSHDQGTTGNPGGGGRSHTLEKLGGGSGVRPSPGKASVGGGTHPWRKQAGMGVWLGLGSRAN